MLNLNDLYKNREEKIQKKLEIYDKVLKKVHNRILNVSHNSIECFCFYIVPNFLFGIPTYNQNDCIKYIFKGLTKNGFKVIYTDPNLLFISWQHIKPKKNNIEDGGMDSKKEKLEIKTTNYKPTGNFIYGDQLSKFKYKSKYLLDN
jgi:hypothetical protein